MGSPSESADEARMTRLRHMSTAAAGLVRPHVPLIRFRGGANAAAAPAAQSTAAQPVAPALTKQASQGSLEWWETPRRLKRKEIDQDEIDAINQGGGDKVW